MQLEARGVRPAELQASVLSRLHNDHAGGLKELVVAAGCSCLRESGALGGIWGASVLYGG